jgi:hypothetical protein
MDNTNTQAEAGQETLQVTMDFSHRLSLCASFNSGILTDSIGMMTVRALGILYLLSGQFEDANYRLNDKLICGAIDAAIQEVEDIAAILLAYHLSEQAKAIHQAKKDPQ